MTLLDEPRSTSSDSVESVTGAVTPRIFTPPLITGPPGPCGCGCALTEATSYGFAVDDFARHVLGMPLDPWERWAVIHGGELLPDGRPRFRKLVVIVARQNGKTFMLVVLALFWLFVDRAPMVFGTSTNLDYAKESWEKAVDLVKEVDVLADDMPRRGGIRYSNGEQTLKTLDKCRYKIGAATRRGGRSLTIWRLILDELREHDKWDAWNASYNAMNAVAEAQVWAITNQGDDTAVVLDSLRNEVVDEDDELRPLEERDIRLGLLEYSAPRGSRADDPAALAMANPNLGHRIGLDDLVADARRVLRGGGEALMTFLIEVLCIRVRNLMPAVDMAAWREKCLEPGPIPPGSRVALVADVSFDELHATLYAAAQLEDGRVRVDPVAAWDGPECTQQLRQDLPRHIDLIKPEQVGWIPNGPAAAIAADMAERPGWPPQGVTFAEIKSEVTAVCMGFAEQVKNGRVVHSDDPLLTDQLDGTERLYHADTWRFARQNGHCDASYAAAGAVHLARTMPVVPQPRIRTLQSPAAG